MPRIALVTGSTRGLGRATADRLARRGDHVIVTGRGGAVAREVAERLRSAGHQADHLSLDVTSRESVAGAAKDIEGRYGRLDVLVNNAGTLPEATAPGPHRFTDLDAFARTFETNVIGAVTVIEHLLPLLRRSEAARIVNVSSTVGSLSDQADPDSPYYRMVVPGYQASKAALNSITIGLAKHLAGTPAKVTSVCPGWVQTDLAPGNRERAPLTPEAAAEVVVRAATLPAGAPSGTFIDVDGTVPW
ncbi:SDR family NAD(P)-dependent oxidoreductase [Kineococcus sp. G2]|uniref:SDR family NAD(P)-dependent oxidoreductase n=1 Tax=Kineococcus sp. G2 TaxID=3127484 RepID=UPI00301BEB59